MVTKSVVEKKRLEVFLDIEIMANLIYAWGIYEQNAVDKYREWYIMSYAYRVKGEKKTHVVALPDFPRFKKDPTDDYDLVKTLWELFDKHDVIIAHNADFDIKKSCARFLHHGLPPPSPYVGVCTKKLAKSRFKMDSNKLDHIGKYTGVGTKLKHQGFDLWKACEAKDKKAWAIMRKYNKMDVDLLVRIYEKMIPWAKNSPKLYFHAKCKYCGSNKTQWRGDYPAKKPYGKRYQCTESGCGQWGHEFLTQKEYAISKKA